MKICKIKNCNNEHTSKGYCGKHYMQVKRYGKISKRNTRTPNKIIDKGTHYEMVLYNNKSEEIARALFSKKHLKEVKKYKWRLSWKGYCFGYKNIRFHHFIKGKPPKGLVTDHINRIKLDNRDENLRFCTQSENCLNRTMPNLTKKAPK